MFKLMRARVVLQIHTVSFVDREKKDHGTSASTGARASASFSRRGDLGSIL